jgi:hypothetical protein
MNDRTPSSHGDALADPTHPAVPAASEAPPGPLDDEPTPRPDQRATQLLVGTAVLSTLLMPLLTPKLPTYVGE